MSDTFRFLAIFLLIAIAFMRAYAGCFNVTSYDSLHTARNITFGTLTGLPMCNYDTNWFIFYVNNSDYVIEVFINFPDNNYANIGLQLNSQENITEAFSAMGNPTMERLAYQPITSGYYYIIVIPYTPLSVDETYSLSLSYHSPPMCPSNIFSPDSSYGEATNLDPYLPTFYYPQMSICGYLNDEFFSFSQEKAFNLDVVIAFNETDIFPILFLLYENLTTFDISENAYLPYQSISSSNVSPGSYFLAVVLYNAWYGNYSFAVNVTETKLLSAESSDSNAIIGTLIGVIGLIAIALLVYFVYRRWRRPKQTQSDLMTTSSVQSMHVPAITTEEKYVIDYNELVEWIEIGKGSFGLVFRCKWRETVVAVKQLKEVDEKSITDFKTEASILTGLRAHPNVVLFLGITSFPQPVTLITEYCEGGSLEKFILANEKIPVNLIGRILLGVARGMLHLHSENIIHRDLAARNILLTANLDAKVSDFGLSRQKEAKEFESKTKSDIGPLKWMSPEAIKKKVYSTKSDVWSYSILMWEVIARREPYPEMDSVAAAMAVCHEDLRPTIPAHCEHVFSRLMQSCWNTDPEERPSFKEICEVLSSYDFSSSKEIVECTEPFREDPKPVLKYSTMGNFEETQISTRDLNDPSVLTSYGRISVIIENDSVNIADQTDTK